MVGAADIDFAPEGPGVLATYAYDLQSRRTTVMRTGGPSTTVSYDDASRMTGLVQDLAGTTDDQTFGFGFTAASQLQSRTQTNDLYKWTAVSSIREYVADGLNRYASVAGTSFAYDLRGNLTSDGARRFCYDLENRLRGVAPVSTDPCVSASSMALAYDPLGRLRQTTSTATTQYLYDGDRLIAAYDGAGTMLRRYVHGPGVDEPIVWYEGSGTADRRHLVTDHQGSVIAAAGSATTRYAYGPYGEPDTWSGSRFRYTGQAALPEVGLYHYKARVYDPVLGRFLQTDPIGYEDGLNWYGYVENDPMNASDPSGLAKGEKPPVPLVGNTCSRTGAMSCAGTYGPPEARGSGDKSAALNDEAGSKSGGTTSTASENARTSYRSPDDAAKAFGREMSRVKACRVVECGTAISRLRNGQYRYARVYIGQRLQVQVPVTQYAVIHSHFSSSTLSREDLSILETNEAIRYSYLIPPDGSILAFNDLGFGQRLSYSDWVSVYTVAGPGFVQR